MTLEVLNQILPNVKKETIKQSTHDTPQENDESRLRSKSCSLEFIRVNCSLNLKNYATLIMQHIYTYLFTFLMSWF